MNTKHVHTCTRPCRITSARTHRRRRPVDPTTVKQKLQKRALVPRARTDPKRYAYGPVNGDDIASHISAGVSSVAINFTDVLTNGTAPIPPLIADNIL